MWPKLPNSSYLKNKAGITAFWIEWFFVLQLLSNHWRRLIHRNARVFTLNKGRTIALVLSLITVAIRSFKKFEAEIRRLAAVITTIALIKGFYMN